MLPGTDILNDDAFAFAARGPVPLNPVPGDNKNNPLDGTGQGDLIQGFGGNDVLRGLKGNDRLEGGTGNDTLDGGAGRDKVFGGGGRDTIKVSAGTDRINGGAGLDTLDASDWKGGVVVNATSLGQSYPSIAANTLTLADGTVQAIFNVESFLGSGFDDTFYTSAAHAAVNGRGGSDKLEASGDYSRIIGGAGEDSLRTDGDFSRIAGGTGSDRIQAYGVGLIVNGGAGDDIINFNHGGTRFDAINVIRGGAGNDTLRWLSSDTDRDLYPEKMKVFGGAGADTFEFGYYQTGTIQDFQPGIDKVDITVHLSNENTSFAELMTMVTDTAHGAVLKLDYNTVYGFEIVFNGLSKADLVDGDFIF